MARRKFKDSATGKVYEVDVDENGNETPVVAPASIADGSKVKFQAPQIPLKIPAKQTILDAPSIPTQEEQFGKPPSAMDQLTMGGGLVGGLLSGGTATGAAAVIRSLLMSGAGTTLGNLVGQTVSSKEEQAASPEKFGVGAAYEEGAKDIAINATLGGALRAGSKVLPFAKKVVTTGPVEAIKDALFNSKIVMPKNAKGQIQQMQLPETMAAIQAAPEVPFTTGMVTKDSMAEDLLAPYMKAKARQAASEANLATAKALLSEDSLAKQGARGASRTQQLRKAWATRENKAYDAVDEIAKTVQGNAAPASVVKKPGMVTEMDANGLPVQVPGMIEEKIPAKVVTGPIRLFDSNEYATNTIKELEANNELIKNDPVLASASNRLINTLKAFTTEKVISYDAARTAQRDLNSLLKGNLNSVTGNDTNRRLTLLKNSLDSDVKKTMEIEWPDGAAEKFQKALDVTRARGNVFTDEINKRVQESTGRGAIPESFYQGAFVNASTAKEVAKAGGVRNAQKAFIGQFQGKYENAMNRTFDGATALAEWGKPATQEVAKELMNSEQRQAYEYFLRRAEVIQGNPSHIGQLALAGSEANAMLGTANDIATLPTNVSSLFSRAGGKLMAIIGMRKFAENVLLNPAKAREAARLITTQAGRPGGDSAAWKFITAANLGEIMLRNEKGEEVIYDTQTGEASKIN